VHPCISYSILISSRIGSFAFLSPLWESSKKNLSREVFKFYYDLFLVPKAFLTDLDGAQCSLIIVLLLILPIENRWRSNMVTLWFNLCAASFAAGGETLRGVNFNLVASITLSLKYFLELESGSRMSAERS
jgi:hypothetical protein